MKYAIKVTELLTRTVIVEADTYDDAEDKVADAFYKGSLVLHEDNSAVDLECADDTEEYIQIFGKNNFEKMDVSWEFELSDREVEKLWDELTDVPFDTNSDGRLVLATDWMDWKKGTMREDIWAWFSQNHSKGITWLVYTYGK